METKVIKNKNYFCFTTETTLNHIHDVAEREVSALYESAHQYGLEQNGPLEFIYFGASNDKDKPFTLLIAMPVKEEKELGESRYSIKNLNEFKCMSYVHKGNIHDLFPVYDQIFGEIFSKGIKPTDQVREVYEKFVDLESPENITEIQIGIQ